MTTPPVPPVRDVNAENALVIQNMHGNVALGSPGGNARPPAIQSLNERFVAQIGQVNSDGFIDELTLYIGAGLGDETRTNLAEKLRLADREDQIGDAKSYKEMCAKIIARHEFSEAAQKILAHILCFINDRFHAEVTPLIQAGATKATVDAALIQKVVEPAVRELDANVLELIQPHIWGMVYFISSKCRIWWDR